MPENENAHSEHESQKEGHGKKSNKLLWLGLGIAAVGLLVTLWLASRTSGGGTTVQGSQPFIPNPTDVTSGSALANTNTPIPSQYQTANNAESEDYWPSVQTSGGSSSGNNNNSGGNKQQSGGNNQQSGGNNNNNSGGNNQQSGPPPVSLPSHNAYVYTTRPGETLASLTNKFGWSPDKQKGGGVGFTYNYGNNAQIFSALGIGVGDTSKSIPTGTQIAA